MNKYELLKEDTINKYGVTLYRIKALKDFGNVRKDDLGGYIGSESNLSHDNNCWVYGNAKILGKARVCGNAHVSGNAQVFGKACVFGNAKVSGNACVCGDAWVYGNVHVYGNAHVFGKDIVTGLAINIPNLCEFNITASKKDDYIRVGCISHTILEWVSYIESGEDFYVTECKDEISHKQCINIIQTVINNFEIG